MIGLMTDPTLSLQTGGILSMLTSLVLILKANWAIQVPYKRTEVWLMLDKGERPMPAVAQQVIGGVLREVYLRFALYAASLALALLCASVVFGLIRRAA